MVAPRAVERRNSFVRYYSPTYLNDRERVVRPRVVFHPYVPQRIFVAPPVRVVRTYAVSPQYVNAAAVPVGYVYSGYVPIYGSYATTVPVAYANNVAMPLPLPVGWSPAPNYNGYNDDSDGDDMYDYAYNQYGNPYSQYASYSQYPYNGQNPYGSQYPYGGQYPYNGQYPYTGYPYGAQSPVPFGNAQLQGVVISDTNNGLLVLTPSLKPIFVNTSIAQQNGYVNGNISPGTFVDVFGYDTGSEFIATAVG
ncbi:MAG TPA: hypothetical protein VFN49_08345 [Candidatus Aquilonibacter sp.]|nr:hypothetical protein [Candidatus Aquilonibacter sp.]